MEPTNFDRQKIYEKLDYTEAPANYNKKLPWIVQQQIGATNGIHYKDRIGKLNDYPSFSLPIPKVQGGIMLDIGTGWGRWLVAGAKKGYIPVGVDLRLEFCHAALETLKNQNFTGYTVVADLHRLPFKKGVFDFVWSFSVLQHTHYNRLTACIQKMREIITTGGYAMLEFPNKMGIRNRFGPVKKYDNDKDIYNSWCVRYYTIQEYRKMFEGVFSHFSFSNHSFLGIGVLPDDLKYVSIKNKFLCLLSLAGSALCKIIPGLKMLSDSVYIKVTNTDEQTNKEAILEFLKNHNTNPNENLNLIPLFACPISGGELHLSPDNTKLISERAGLYYPIVNGVPILIKSEALPLT